MDEAFFVNARSLIFEIDASFDRFAQVSNELYVDVGFQKGGAYLFDHAIKSLRELISNFARICVRGIISYLFIKIARAGQVGNGSINAPAQVLENHDG